MTQERRPIDPETIACEICMKEIPVSETTSDEASDYVVHYCSVDCYAKWKEQNEKKINTFLDRANTANPQAIAQAD